MEGRKVIEERETETERKRQTETEEEEERTREAGRKEVKCAKLPLL